MLPLNPKRQQSPRDDDVYSSDSSANVVPRPFKRGRTVSFKRTQDACDDDDDEFEHMLPGYRDEAIHDLARSVPELGDSRQTENKSGSANCADLAKGTAIKGCGNGNSDGNSNYFGNGDSEQLDSNSGNSPDSDSDVGEGDRNQNYSSDDSYDWNDGREVIHIGDEVIEIDDEDDDDINPYVGAGEGDGNYCHYVPPSGDTEEKNATGNEFDEDEHIDPDLVVLSVCVHESDILPTTLNEAIKSREAPQWRHAMDSHISDLVNNGTWTLVERPKNMRILRSEWVFRKTTNRAGGGVTDLNDKIEVNSGNGASGQPMKAYSGDDMGSTAAASTSAVCSGIASTPDPAAAATAEVSPTGTLEASPASIDDAADIYHAHIVAVEHTRYESVAEFEESNFPTSSLRVFLSICSQFGYEIHDMDVACTYLNAELREYYAEGQQDIYMEQPPGYVQIETDLEDPVCRLRRVVRGLRIPPKSAYSRIQNVLIKSLGFTQCPSEDVLYAISTQEAKIYAALYRDVLLIAGDNPARVEQIRNCCAQALNMALSPAWVRGMINESLGLKVSRTLGGYRVSQQTYIESLLSQFGMSDCGANNVPISKELFKTMNTDWRTGSKNKKEKKKKGKSKQIKKRVKNMQTQKTTGGRQSADGDSSANTLEAQNYNRDICANEIGDDEKNEKCEPNRGADGHVKDKMGGLHEATRTDNDSNSRRSNNRIGITIKNIRKTAHENNRSHNGRVSHFIVRPYHDVKKYQQAIGMLFVLMRCSRPDLCYVVSLLSQYVRHPSTVHWAAVKSVFRYLYRTKDYMMYFTPSADFQLSGYSDADFANELDRHSRSGCYFSLGGCPIIWTSRKQSIIAGNTGASELTALYGCVKTALWLRNLLSELGQPTTPVLYDDNTSTIAMIKRGKCQEARHLDVYCKIIRQRWIGLRHIDIRFLGTEEMIADTFTKPLSKEKFDKFNESMMLSGQMVAT